MEEFQICPHCGKKTPEENLRCIYCGERLPAKGGWISSLRFGSGRLLFLLLALFVLFLLLRLWLR